MDTVIEFVTGLFILGAFVPLSAAFKPWGPFKKRWIGAALAFAAFLIGGMLLKVPPARPSAIPQAEWDRRIALCSEHAAGQFRDCVRDAAELKRAEQEVAELKKAEVAKAASSPIAPPGRSADGPSPPDPRDKRLADNSKIAAGALSPYTRKDDPDIFAQWGAKGVHRIEAMRRAAAYVVSKKPECDAVGRTDIADQRSRPPSKIVIHVICQNWTDYFLSQSEIEHGAQSEAERQQQVEDSWFQRACSEAIRPMLTYPSSYKERGGDTFKNDDGNYGYVIPFDAKNGLGIVVPQIAHCTVQPNRKVKVEIHNR